VALAKIVAYAALALALFGIGTSVWTKWDVGRKGERYMVVSSRSPGDDLFFRELATQTAVFRYTRADSALATELRRQMPFQGRLAVYTERGGRTVSVSTSIADIARATEAGTRSVESQRLPAVYLGTVAGAALGMLLGPSLWVFLAGLTIAAGAAVQKLVAGCPTCEPSSFMGFRVEALGAGVLTAAAMALGAGFVTPMILALLTSLTILGQVAATLAAGTDCVACSVVAGGCSLVSFAFASREATPLSRRPWNVVLSPLVVAAAWILTPRTPAPASADLLRSSTSWLGKDVRELGDFEVPRKGRRLVIVWSRGCRPCAEALERLALEPDLSPDLYLGLPPGGSARARGEKSVQLRGMLDQTPAFFVVDERGTVLSEYKGWAFDKGWEDQFVKTLRHDLGSTD